MHFDREQLDCPVHEIAAYIDGELDETRQSELDAHFEACRECTAELNSQKAFLCELNSRLAHVGEVEVPADFTKRIVVTAESSVIGLRPAHERYNALFICAGLLVFALFAMGAESGKMLAALEKTAVAGGFVGHLLYSLFVGFVVILRSFAAQFQPVDLLGLVVAAFLGVAILVVYRRFSRAARA